MAAQSEDPNPDAMPDAAGGRGAEQRQHLGSIHGPDLWDVWTVSQVQAYSIMILTTFVCFYLLIKLCRRCMRGVLTEDQPPFACDTQHSSKANSSRGTNGRRQNSMSMSAVHQSIPEEQNNRLIQ